MRRLGPSDEGGFSLIEILVAMSLFVLVGTLTLNVVVSGVRSQATLTERASAMANMREAAQRISRDVREADPVLHAEPRLLVIRQRLAGAVTRDLTYQVIGTNLVQDQTSTSAAGTVTVSPRLIIGFQIDPTANLFGYIKAPGYVTSGSSVDATTCAIAGTSPTSYSGDCLGSITLRLTHTLRRGSPLNLDQTIELRNQ